MNQVTMRHGYLDSNRHATGPVRPARVSGEGDLCRRSRHDQCPALAPNITMPSAPSPSMSRHLDIMLEDLTRNKLTGAPEIDDMMSQFKGVTLYDHQEEGIR